MRRRTVWTDAMDEALRGLREAGRTWDAIACEMGLGRNTVLERGRKVGARRKKMAMAEPGGDMPDRPARPPGHPVTWGLITAGTPIEGARYPYPVYL